MTAPRGDAAGPEAGPPGTDYGRAPVPAGSGVVLPVVPDVGAHTPAGRSAIAELFLREYHRLGGAAARAAPHDPHAAQLLRRRAAAWRTTAGRVRAVAATRWPAWLLTHLAGCESLPVVGAEYARQRAYLERVTGGAARAGHPADATPPE